MGVMARIKKKVRFFAKKNWSHDLAMQNKENQTFETYDKVQEMMEEKNRRSRKESKKLETYRF